MQPAFATVALPFPAANADAVKAVLAEMGHPAGPAVQQRLDEIGLIHFMSMSVVPNTTLDHAHFVLELTADCGVDEALDAVAGALEPWLVRVFAAAGHREVGDRALVARHLRRCCLTLGQGWRAAACRPGKAPGLPFCGTPGMTVQRIREEAALAHQIGAMQDALYGDATPLEKLERVRNRLWADESAKWAFLCEPAPMLQPAPAPTQAETLLGLVSAVLGTLWALLWPYLLGAFVLVWAVLWWLPVLVLPGAGWSWVLVGFVVSLLVAGGLGLAAVLLAFIHLRRLETTDRPVDRAPDGRKVATLMAHDNFGAQNLLPSVSTLKPGRFRRFTLNFAFGLIARGNSGHSRPGFLGTMGMIHFARWVRLPGTDKLLFWSNFDGSWNGYVETFVEQESTGVNMIWSNAEEFPRTTELAFDGSGDGNRLVRWARRQQYEVPFWYSAYPDLTLDRIRRNAAIRQGIAAITTDVDAADWLACFGAEPRSASALEADEIPTLVFGAHKPLRFCTCLVVTLADSVPACQAWLSGIADEITYGHQRPTEAVAVTFSRDGLKKFGVHEDDLLTFNPAFQTGMTDAGRSRALGDVGPSDPQTWRWGNPQRPADAFLVLLARDAADLATSRERHLAALTQQGHTVAYELPALPNPENAPRTEPFGFVDGISNPILAGTWRANDPAQAAQVVAPGEIVLGYKDNSTYVSATALVASERDPAHRLPDPARTDQTTRLWFEAGSPPPYRDFGRNGTYLVVRQIEQDVAAFNGYLDAQVRALPDLPLWPEAEAAQRGGWLKELIAAKLVGRWREGHSIVKYPDRPPAAADAPLPDNDFLFGRDDAQGLHCPMGAHIHRANPRDSFDIETPDQLSVSNRRRILRVGRPYQPADGEKPGLIFMCLNADIERQFEFVQQTWLRNRSFHDLEDERDPILGAGGAFTIPTHHGPVRLAGLPSFTTISGGGYFFMPSRRAIRFLCGS